MQEEWTPFICDLSMHVHECVYSFCISVSLPASVLEMCRVGRLLRLASLIFCQFERVQAAWGLI